MSEKVVFRARLPNLDFNVGASPDRGTIEDPETYGKYKETIAVGVPLRHSV